MPRNTKSSLWNSSAHTSARSRARAAIWDILVTFKNAPSLLKFVELENLLSETLGVKVDLVMKDVLKPGIRERILQEAVSDMMSERNYSH